MNTFPHVCALALGLAAMLPLPAYTQTSSPFPPPEEGLGVYVINSGPGLDTGCTFRSGGPLIIQLHVPATMNPAELDADGYLIDPQKLIDNSVIGADARFSFPVYDIDDKASTSGFAPEINHVFLNGEFMQVLSGQNNTWTPGDFTVPIDKVRFGATNEIRVDIDTGNVGAGEYWCMAVDWVAVEFDAAVPYVLAHGISASRDTWLEATATGVLTTMDRSGVLYDRFSTTNPNGAVNANAQELKTQIGAFLEQTKSKKVHIIAHSKGGLDSQFLATISKPEFEILSLSTLSTPHRGSPVADLQLMQRQEIDEYINSGQDPDGHAQAFVTRSVAGWASREQGAGPQPPGLNDLTTQAATTALLQGVRGGNTVPHVFTVAADAGPNCSRAPTDAEIAPMADEAPFGTGGYVRDTLRAAYQVICSIASATQLRVATQSTWGGLSSRTVLVYESVANTAPNPNDIVVGVQSAHPGWGTELATNQSTNHTEVKNGANVQLFLDRTVPLR
jgi:triacylglycerol lipase